MAAVRSSQPSMERCAPTPSQALIFQGHLCTALSRLWFLCSDTLDSSIATVEQQIRDVEASISNAESEAAKAKDAGDAEERKV